MRLEFLPDGSPDCPILRIFDFDSVGADFLRRHVISLADGDLTVIFVHEFTIVEAIDGCRLVLKASDADLGVVKISVDNEFECLLTEATWTQVAALMEPFCVPVDHRGTFQWLDETSDISFLFSPDGMW
jgi:hypothetical protein